MAKREHLPVVVSSAPKTETPNVEQVQLGEWYWLKNDKGTVLVCVMHVGSNYVKLTSPHNESWRVHLDKFDSLCTKVEDPTSFINEETERHQQEVRSLMAEVRDLTMRLGISARPGLPSTGSTESGAALVTLHSVPDVGEHKTALIRAKEKELPELFEKIKKANEQTAIWMKAHSLPSRAELHHLQASVGRIDDRIFTIELYAGLVEEVKRIADGKPPEAYEPIHLMQLRRYMDEECLAEYEAGGMSFKDIKEFDRWLCKPSNRDRLLPFPRTIVAFRVRRHRKDYGVPRSYIEFFEMIEKERADSRTFLYIRNGEQIYRLHTGIEFDETLFDDAKHSLLMQSGTKIWMKDDGRGLISDNEFQGLCEDYDQKLIDHKIAERAHARKMREWRRRKQLAKEQRQKFNEYAPDKPHFWESDPKKVYVPYTPRSVYYDDATGRIAKEMKEHNRIMMIVQGLLDRSPVFSPHPMWRIWEAAEYEQALKLVYDSSRAFVAGPEPDFEAYRAQLNASLSAGCVTIGQQVAWREENTGYDRRGNERRKRYYDEGPGILAKVLSYSPRSGKCSYAWLRRGETYETREKQFRTLLTCDSSDVLNVSAYKKGDFKQFFADPRTRAQYLQWAPLLLEAEEYHAGNREEPPEPPQAEPRTPTVEGRIAYQRRKACKDLVGKRVRLRHRVTTTGGKTYPAASLWLVVSSEGRTVRIRQLDKEGKETDDWVSKMEPYDLVSEEP